MYTPATFESCPWMEFAYLHEASGTSEIKGKGCNLNIAAFLRSVGLPSSDEISWCSAFVNWCMEQACYTGTGRGNARSWLTWGKEEPRKNPRFGAIAVFWRVSPKSWKGHVGFHVGDSGNDILVLGGNQGNKVCVRPYNRGRLLGYRWPM